MTAREYVIKVPGRPYSLNAERTRHWSDRAERVAQFRRDAKLVTFEALGFVHAKPVLDAVTVEVFPWAIDRRYRQDVANCYGSFKACLDGAVDAGLIADDDDRYVKAVTFYPHQFGADQMVLRFREVGS